MGRSCKHLQLEWMVPQVLHWRCINSILGGVQSSATSWFFATVWHLAKHLGEQCTADNKGSCRTQELPSYYLEPTKVQKSNFHSCANMLKPRFETKLSNLLFGILLDDPNLVDRDSHGPDRSEITWYPLGVYPKTLASKTCPERHPGASSPY